MMHHCTKFCNERFSSWERSDPDENSLKYLTFAVTLILTTTQQCNLFMRQPNLWRCAIKLRFVCNRICRTEDKVESHVLIVWTITMLLSLKTANQPFCMTLWLIMMHHHIKFGNKQFSSSEDIFWTNSQWHFWSFTVTLTFNTPIRFFLLQKTLQLTLKYHETKFACKRIKVK